MADQNKQQGKKDDDYESKPHERSTMAQEKAVAVTVDDAGLEHVGLTGKLGVLRFLDACKFGAQLVGTFRRAVRQGIGFAAAVPVAAIFCHARARRRCVAALTDDAAAPL